MNVLIMKPPKAINVPACVQLAARQNLCIPNLPMLKCYNLAASHSFKHYQNDVIRCLPESQNNCDSGGMPLGARGKPSSDGPPHMDIGKPPEGFYTRKFFTPEN
jgi:hypothetical protein